VLGHDALGERVVGIHPLAVAGDPRRQDVDGSDLRAGAPREDRRQAEVVHVLVGDDDELEVLDPPPVLGKRLLERVERRARVRSGVDKGQRVVVEEIRVDAADLERRRDRQAVDARAGRPRERVVHRKNLPSELLPTVVEQ